MPRTRKDYDRNLVLYAPPTIEFCGGLRKIVFTVNSQSDSVSSIGILEACHIPGKTIAE
jgi:hypothetical protein